MKVREIMSSHVMQIADNMNLIKAAQKMQSADVGALPVQKDNKTIGLITDRDIVVRAISAELDPKTTLVKEVMSPDVLCCSEEDDIETAERIMEDNKVHHLVVLGRDNTVVGVLSLGDLALKTSNEHLAYRALERICEPVRTA
ncbi:MAG: CBS domain-containing protein [Sedimentisphaerales bacterium]|nr:CBS domain-containing protein [Sedimentisphaerales bacterium]